MADSESEWELSDFEDQPPKIKKSKKKNNTVEPLPHVIFGREKVKMMLSGLGHRPRVNQEIPDSSQEWRQYKYDPSMGSERQFWEKTVGSRPIMTIDSTDVGIKVHRQPGDPVPRRMSSREYHNRVTAFENKYWGKRITPEMYMEYMQWCDLSIYNFTVEAEALVRKDPRLLRKRKVCPQFMRERCLQRRREARERVREARRERSEQVLPRPAGNITPGHMSIRCCKCGKLRHVHPSTDVAEIGRSWQCSSAGLTCKSNTSKPSTASPASSHFVIPLKFEDRYPEGSLVAVKLPRKETLWPALVECDPNHKSHFVVSRPKAVMKPMAYHVTLLGDPVKRTWLYTRHLRPIKELLYEAPTAGFAEAMGMLDRVREIPRPDRCRLWGFLTRYPGRVKHEPDFGDESPPFPNFSVPDDDMEAETSDTESEKLQAACDVTGKPQTTSMQNITSSRSKNHEMKALVNNVFPSDRPNAEYLPLLESDIERAKTDYEVYVLGDLMIPAEIHPPPLPDLLDDDDEEQFSDDAMIWIYSPDVFDNEGFSEYFYQMDLRNKVESQRARVKREL